MIEVEKRQLHILVVQVFNVDACFIYMHLVTHHQRVLPVLSDIIDIEPVAIGCLALESLEKNN